MLEFYIVLWYVWKKHNIGTWKKVREWMKIWNKWVKDMKRRGQKEHSKQGDKQNKFILNNKTYIDTLKILLILHC